MDYRSLEFEIGIICNPSKKFLIILVLVPFWRNELADPVSQLAPNHALQRCGVGESLDTFVI